MVAIDSESDSLHHFPEKVCLIQVGTAEGEVFLVDPLVLRDLAPLAPMLADPAVVKVLHGAAYDLASMKRDFGVRDSPGSSIPWSPPSSSACPRSDWRRCSRRILGDRVGRVAAEGRLGGPPPERGAGALRGRGRPASVPAPGAADGLACGVRARRLGRGGVPGPGRDAGGGTGVPSGRLPRDQGRANLGPAGTRYPAGTVRRPRGLGARAGAAAVQGARQRDAPPCGGGAAGDAGRLDRRSRAARRPWWHDTGTGSCRRWRGVSSCPRRTSRSCGGPPSRAWRRPSSGASPPCWRGGRTRRPAWAWIRASCCRGD